MNEMQECRQQRAVVIGGSMAGLLAAGVLSGFYEEVIVVEKDELPDGPELRPGTPQAFHPHRLTPRGLELLERYFPGFNEELLGHGAPSTLNGFNHMSNEHGILVMGPDPENHASCTRSLLEWVIRRRARAVPGIRFLTKQEVTGLLSPPDSTAVTGVLVRERGSEGQRRTLAADLVVETGGRVSRLTAWLNELGYEVPAPDRLHLNLGYSTRRYRVPDGTERSWNVIHTSGCASEGRATGVFSPIENGLAESVLYSAGGVYPTTEAERYAQEAGALTSPVLAEAIRDLEPLGPPRAFRVPELVRRRYGHMTRWPAGLLVLGDAFCHFDPIFGQGITVAAMEAELLEECLREERGQPREGFELRVLGRMQELIEPAWWLNCTAALRWKGVEYTGTVQLEGVEFAQRYLDQYHRHVMQEQSMELYGLFWAVNTLLAPPNELVRPELMDAVLAGASENDRAWFDALAQQHGVRTSGLPAVLLPSFFCSTAAEVPKA
ncbi:NAD(P)/FAD-dependent oxidoreductase [Paenibacillus sp. S-38]|uniref:NAD(P)/FAD-dependent oxidoreductase n=1 Tax=Paenibacillus sp. S-38 TaxID=3416710 RepID=UPI003CE9B0A1